MRGFPAFVICFVLLMMFWNAHFRYHRRYGLEDIFSRVMTMAILVLVLFFVYPLKFLFTLLTVHLFGLDMLNRADARRRLAGGFALPDLRRWDSPRRGGCTPRCMRMRSPSAPSSSSMRWSCCTRAPRSTRR